MVFRLVPEEKVRLGTLSLPSFPPALPNKKNLRAWIRLVQAARVAKPALSSASTPTKIRSAIQGLGFRDIIPIVENQMDKNMEHGMATGVIQWG